MYCPKCDKTFKIIEYSLFDGAETPITGTFCPQCGWYPEYSGVPVEVAYEIQETNLFDRVTTYTNCIVEVLENSVTGEISIGWYKTDKTEEIPLE